MLYNRECLICILITWYLKLKGQNIENVCYSGRIWKPTLLVSESGENNEISKMAYCDLVGLKLCSRSILNQGCIGNL